MIDGRIAVVALQMKPFPWRWRLHFRRHKLLVLKLAHARPRSLVFRPATFMCDRVVLEGSRVSNLLDSFRSLHGAKSSPRYRSLLVRLVQTRRPMRCRMHGPLGNIPEPMLPNEAFARAIHGAIGAERRREMLLLGRSRASYREVRTHVQGRAIQFAECCGGLVLAPCLERVGIWRERSIIERAVKVTQPTARATQLLTECREICGAISSGA